MATDDRARLVKAHLVGSDRVVSNVVHIDDRASKQFTAAGALDPPMDPETLCMLLEHSNSLRQNIDAYAVNIDGFGHRFEPVIDLDADDSLDTIRDALLEERSHAQERGIGSTAAAVPTDDDVIAARDRLREEFRRERSKLERFFDFCCPSESFVSLRRRTRVEKETLGNAWWEVLRNPFGELAEFSMVPGFTVRLLALDTEPIEVKERVRISALSFAEVRRCRRFRRFVQVVDGRSVFFKELGDPRVISRKTGGVFASLEEMRTLDPEDGPATELLHFAIHNPRTPYGVPRWLGNLLSVIGSRQAEEVNVAYFENKSIPPLVVTVSGGRLTEETITHLQATIENEIKGKKNFHKILILEGEPDASGAENAGRMRIDIKPLTGAQLSDAQWQKYDERNIDKVGMSFRLPRLLRGDVRDFNRGTALASLEFAEAQIFAPEREDFDWVVNRLILSEMGIRFWRFRSNGPIKRDPQTMADMVTQAVKMNILTPAEARDLMSEVLRRDLKRIDADWTKQPVPLTLAGFPVEQAGESVAVAQGKSLADQALDLIELRDELRAIESEQSSDEFAKDDDPDRP